MKKGPLVSQKIEKKFDELYEEYGKPLEKDHWGDFLAVSPTGEILLGKNMTKVAKKAYDLFGSGVFLYKVGEKAVGKWLKVF